MKYCNTCGIDEDRYDAQAQRIRDLEAALREVLEEVGVYEPDYSITVRVRELLGKASQPDAFDGNATSEYPSAHNPQADGFSEQGK